MKRLEPEYKSQNIPSEKENKGILKKIVGKTFINQVYEQPDRSIIILFIDSKDEESYRKEKKVVEDFAIKYKDNFMDKLTLGIFDLAKNEHKLLYLKQAPQLILFDKTNKKRIKYFKMSEGISI